MAKETGSRILVIDDDEIIQGAFEAVFKRAGFEYVPAITAAEGLAALDAGCFDVAIVDGLLPDRSGVSVCGAIRSIEAHKKVKLIFLSGHFKQAAIFTKLIVDFKVDLVLHKPIAPEEIFKHTLRLLSEGEDAARIDKGDDKDDLFAELKKGYIENFHLNIGKIESLLREIKPGVKPRAQFTDLLFIVHKMHGSAGIFGFGKAGNTAGEWEEELQKASVTGEALSEELLWRFDNYFSRIKLDFQLQRDDVDANSSFFGDAETPDAELPRILLVDGDEELAQKLDSMAEQNGFRFKSCRKPGEAIREAALEKPDVIFMEVDYDVYMDGYSLARKLRELHKLKKTPLIFTSKKSSLIDRVQAVRAGAAGFIDKPAAPELYFKAARKLLASLADADGVVCFVDPDNTFLENAKRTFAKSGIRIEVFNSPLKLWELLERNMPDLIFMNYSLDKFSGADICRALKSDSRWSNIHVLLMTESARHDIMREIVDSGADGYILKPVSSQQLAAKAGSHLDQVKMRRVYNEKDGLTGILNRKAFCEALIKLCEDEEGAPPVVSVALIGIDCLAKFNEEFGFPAGDELIKRLSAKLSEIEPHGCLAGRWSGNNFAIAQKGARRQELVDLVAGILDEFREIRFESLNGETFNATFSSGVAEYPVDAKDVERLLRAAELALEKADCGGGDMVATAKTEPSGEDRPDVLIVDDDDTVRRIVGYALKTRGYSYEELPDGDSARKRLLGDENQPLPRIILLDVNIPGTDGFSLLKLLKDSPLGNQTKVVMLTAHGREEDLVKGFEIGAVDFVAKPFSVPILMHRIRIAML